MKPTRIEPAQYQHRAPALRASMTDAEARLWRALRGKRMGEVRFRRQAAIGPYVVDFICHAARLVIEIDGGQHAEASAQGRDAARDLWLADRGYRVLRFWNSEVMENIDGVLATIASAVGERKSAK